MTRIVIREIIWDSWNVIHIDRHKVSQQEALEAGKNIVYHKVTYNGRYLVIGRSGNRLIALVVVRKKTGTYYLITARDASKPERRKVYEKEKK